MRSESPGQQIAVGHRSSAADYVILVHLDRVRLIHGSCPNSSKERFRRALAGHYVAGEAEKVSAYYHPILRMDGTEVELGASEGGEPCGVWVDRDGNPEVEMRPVGAWQPHMQGIGEASS